METDARQFLTSLLSNRWFQSVLWVCGGYLWLSSVFSKPPTTNSSPRPTLTLQKTQIDGQRRLAWIDGQKVQTGQVLKTSQGVYRVQKIEPGTALLSQGGQRLRLKLPQSETFENGQTLSSIAGW